MPSPSSSAFKSHMRSFFVSVGDTVRSCFAMDRHPGLERSSTTFNVKLGEMADKMVGPDMGLPRTYNLRKLLADPDGRSVKREKMEKARLFTLNDTDFIIELDKAFHKEFVTLSTASGATVEKGSDPVVGGYGPNKQSPSQLLFNGEFYSEVDRTIVGILCMKWILTDRYDDFVLAQLPPIKLSRGEFRALRKNFIDTFGDTTSSYMLIISMIVNDLGKNEDLRKQIKAAADENNDPEAAAVVAEVRKRSSTMNHDEVIWYAAKLGLLELINEFDGTRRTRLELGIQFGGMLNIGQLAQAENVPGSLKGIGEVMKRDPQAFPMKFLEVVLDVAGAQGHVDSRCSKAWSSPVNLSYENARICVLDVIENNGGERLAYDRILSHRAQLLSDRGWTKTLSTDVPRQRALLRLITLARAADASSAQRMEDILDSLPTHKTKPEIRDFLNRPIDNIQEALINGLTVDGLDDGVAIIPYYAPGLLAEIARVTKVQDDDIKRRAIAAFCRLMARALVGSRPDPSLKKGYVMECDLSFVQDRLRSPAFASNPDVLDELEPKDGIYSDDVAERMRECYGIRPLSRRNTPKSPAVS